jgi:carbamoylphosphate synthase large subunit
MSNQRKLHILVMSASWQSALACIQSFGRAGHTVSIVPTNVWSPIYSSVFVKNSFKLAATATEETAFELLQLVRQQGIDLVIPVSDQDAALVATAKRLVPGTNTFIISPPETIALARSRNKTIELARRLGIGTPKTAFVTHDNAAASARELGYPCFLKLSGSVASGGVFHLSDEEQLNKKLVTIPRQTEMQLQQRIDSAVFGVMGFALEGKLIESFAFRKDNLLFKAGTTAYASRIRDERLHAMLSTIAKDLSWTGAIDLDLLQGPDGNYLLMEINPRLSGTSVFPLKLGIDLPMHYVHALLGIDAKPHFKPSNPNAERFISLAEETRHLRAAGESGREFSMNYRADGNWVDNGFWDDWRYSAAFFEMVRRWLLQAKV